MEGVYNGSYFNILLMQSNSKLYKDWKFTPINVKELLCTIDCYKNNPIISESETWMMGKLFGKLLVFEKGDDFPFSDDFCNEFSKKILRALKSSLKWFYIVGIMFYKIKFKKESNSFEIIVPDIENGTIYVGYDSLTTKKKFFFIKKKLFNQDFDEEDIDKELDEFVCYDFSEKSPSINGFLNSPLSKVSQKWMMFFNKRKMGNIMLDKICKKSDYITTDVPDSSEKMKNFFKLYEKTAPNKYSQVDSSAYIKNKMTENLNIASEEEEEEYNFEKNHIKKAEMQKIDYDVENDLKFLNPGMNFIKNEFQNPGFPTEYEIEEITIEIGKCVFSPLRKSQYRENNRIEVDILKTKIKSFVFEVEELGTRMIRTIILKMIINVYMDQFENYSIDHVFDRIEKVLSSINLRINTSIDGEFSWNDFEKQYEKGRIDSEFFNDKMSEYFSMPNNYSNSKKSNPKKKENKIDIPNKD